MTFACYGQHLHGDDSGSVDLRHNLLGSPLVAANAQRVATARRYMNRPAYALDHASRAVVLQSIREVCAHRHWTLLAAHVRTNHVHVVLESELRPEKVLGDLKSYASRALNHLRPDESDRKRWARHGSTRWLWTDGDVRGAVKYVIEEQGEPMAVFVLDDSTDPRP